MRCKTTDGLPRNFIEVSAKDRKVIFNFDYDEDGNLTWDGRFQRPKAWVNRVGKANAFKMAENDITVVDMLSHLAYFPEGFKYPVCDTSRAKELYAKAILPHVVAYFGERHDLANVTRDAMKGEKIYPSSITWWTERYNTRTCKCGKAYFYWHENEDPYLCPKCDE